jgi:hypothetical protein
MSAFLCGEFHLNLIVGYVGGTEADFNMLRDANLRSVLHRYPHHAAEFEAEAAELTFAKLDATKEITDAFAGATLPEGNVVATQIVKLCDCFDYQACEIDDYDDTPAKRFVDEIRNSAVSAGGERSSGRNGTSPLWDALKWGM